MRQYLAILVALSLASTAFAGAGPKRSTFDAAGPVDAAQSAGLFVGIREFSFDRTLAEVRYAVDDAVDLAHAFVFEHNPPLVDPQRVVLALSGEPQKQESVARLQQLLKAGATRRSAGHSELLTLLQSQAAKVGVDGILIVSFATHGVSEDGVQYLLAADSLLRRRTTKIADADINDIISLTETRRAFILLDACRQQLVRDARAGEADPRSAAALLEDLARIDGRVVLSAAVQGKYAYDDEVQRNGVFTAAVLDGLSCRAGKDANGYVTVETLAAFVEERVLQWIRRNKDKTARVATQLQYEGAAKRMPLAACLNDTAVAQAPHRE